MLVVFPIQSHLVQQPLDGDQTTTATAKQVKRLVPLRAAIAIYVKTGKIAQPARALSITMTRPLEEDIGFGLCL